MGFENNFKSEGEKMVVPPEVLKLAEKAREEWVRVIHNYINLVTHDGKDPWVNREACEKYIEKIKNKQKFNEQNLFFLEVILGMLYTAINNIDIPTESPHHSQILKLILDGQGGA
ncbi:MAG: hypothetical protein AAB453_03370 [Patescibacteria group bacterium]